MLVGGVCFSCVFWLQKHDSGDEYDRGRKLTRLGDGSHHLRRAKLGINAEFGSSVDVLFSVVVGICEIKPVYLGDTEVLYELDALLLWVTASWC